MRKKYLSALLFGALLFASAGTFTSCKDYDDDIKNLQEQINTISTTLEDLEAQVGQTGVSSVTFDEATGVLTVVDAEGTHTYTVKTSAGEVGEITISIDGKNLVVNGEVVGEVGDKVAVNDEGELTINGEGTGITVGQYAILENEADNMYTITLPDANGELKTIQLPKATSAITEVEIMGYVKDGVLAAAEKQNIKYNYTYLASLSDDLKEWNKEEGVRTVVEKQVLSTLSASNSSLMMRLAPATLDASGMSFTLVNSKLEEAPIALGTPEAYEGLLTRAAVNNGIWTLPTVANVEDTYNSGAEYEENFANGKNKIAFALKEANGFISSYDLTFEKADFSLDSKVEKVNDADVVGSSVSEYSNSTLQTLSDNKVNKVNAGKVELTFSNPIYDAHLHIDDATIQRWAITDIDGTSFTVGKRPDDITSANFQVNVHYVTLEGKVKNEWIPMTVAKSFAGQTVLAQTDHMINAEASKDKFAVSLDNMFTDLGTNEALWKSDVTKATVELYQVGTAADGKDKQITIPTAPNAISFTVADKDGKDATSDLSKATQIIADFKQNWPATGDDYALDESYYVLVSFMDANNDVLNTVKVPFTMNIPALSTFLQKQQGVFNGTSDGTAYVFGTSMRNTSQTDKLPLQYDLTYAFVGGLKNLGTTVIEFTTNGYINGDENNSKGSLVGLALSSKQTIVDSDCYDTGTTADGKLTLVALNGKNDDAYGQVFKIEVSSAKYLNKYAYSEDARKAETFTIKMLSPIKEGKISAADGSQTINVTATDNQMIKESAFHAETYAAVAYELFPSATTKKASQIYDWISYNALETITIVPEDDRVLKVTEIKNTVDATTTAEEVEGYVKVEPVNPAYDTTGDIIVTVNDVWGFSNKQNITVNIAR